MRFTYAEAMTQATYYAPLAQAAEAAGYTSMTVADSLIYPEESDSKYPYTDTGDREFLEGKEFIETMVLCAHLFAVTTTLRLTPFVLKLPVRPPVLVAKQASSLAFLSGNRLGLGVGLSPWPEDFAALGVPWEKRGKRMDECMDILRGLTDAASSSATPASSTRSSRSSSAPRRPRRSRCWSAATPTPRCAAPCSRATAGCTPAATARSSTGCSTRLAEIRKEEGDTRDDFEVHVISYDAYDLDGVKRLEDKGVTDCIVGLPGALHQGPRHRAAGEEDRAPGAVRRVRSSQKVNA